jgi:hypothetical protein
VKRPDWTVDSRTWHPSVIEGAQDTYFGGERGLVPDNAIKRTIIGLGVVATSLMPFHDVAAARTNPPEKFVREYSYSPDQGEVVPLIGSMGRDVSTSLHFSEEIERSRSTLRYFKNEVLAWHSRLCKRHFAGVNKRLDFLFEDEPDLSKSQASPDIDSFGVLLAFLAHHPELNTPSIGFNRDGVFSGTWAGDKKLRVSLDFISSTSIRWVFVDSRHGLKGAVTGAGMVPLDVLAGILGVYGAWEWMKS